LKKGQTYIKHVSSDWIAKSVESELFVPTSDMARLSEPDVIMICVPTPLGEGREPDLGCVKAVTEDISKVLRKGQLIVLECSTYPGTTRDVVLPILKKSGLKMGEEFFLAYSPEREDPGNAVYGTSTIPKIVGGIDKTSTELATMVYRRVIAEVVPVRSCEAAEAAKILENTYRSVNIAMVNEMKVLLHKMGVDVWEVIDAAKTKPFGFQAFYPGPGLGGHCIPIDPFYLAWVAKKLEMPTRFIELAGEINTSMPNFVVSRVGEALNDQSKPFKGSKVCLLGISYKKDIDDMRESPSFKLIELLESRGVVLTYNDDHFPELTNTSKPMRSVLLTAEYLSSVDCVLVSTDHSYYDWAFIHQHAKLIVDTRNALREFESEKIYKA